MYPYAETAQGVEDSLDPDAFAYTIISNTDLLKFLDASVSFI